MKKAEMITEICALLSCDTLGTMECMNKAEIEILWKSLHKHRKEFKDIKDLLDLVKRR